MSAGYVRGESKPLPSFIKPCSRKDPNLNKCAAASGTLAIPKMKNGLPDYGVPKLDPLSIKEIKFDKKALGLNMVIKDALLYGLGETQILGIDIQLDPPAYKWELMGPRLVLVGKYEADGRILLLPITGKGDVNITLDNVGYTYSFKNNLVKKADGEEYLVPITSDLDYKVGHTYITLDNLFNGNKLLGEELNRFMNENWKDITDLLGPSIARAIAVTIKSMVENLTSRVPYDKLLPK